MSEQMLRETLKDEREKIAALIVERNRDLGERVGQLGLTLTYDDAEDTLTLTIGKPQEAVTESVDNRLFFRLDPETLAIVGIEVLNFRTLHKDRPDFLPLLIDLLQAAGAKLIVESPPSPALTDERLREDIKGLVPA